MTLLSFHRTKELEPRPHNHLHACSRHHFQGLAEAEKHAADMKATLELERRRHEKEIAKSAGGLETGKMQVR